MEGLNTEAINFCNRLIMRNEDSADDFRHAAEVAHSETIKEMLSDVAEKRAFAVIDLQGEVVSLGSEPNAGGSASATLHRGWTRLKGLVSGHSDADVIAECVESEEKTLEAYREALTAPLPTLTRELFERHYSEVLANQQSLRTFTAARV